MKHFLIALISVLLIFPALAQKKPPMGRPAATQDQVKLEASQAAKLTKEQLASKSAFVKHGKDAKLKKKYIDSTVDVGVFYVSAKSFPPKIQYPTALRYFREALKVDPNNKTARQWKDQIEGIYKSMGRPIPPQ